MNRSFSEGVRDAFDREADMDRAMSMDGTMGAMGMHGKQPPFGEPPLPPPRHSVLVCVLHHTVHLLVLAAFQCRSAQPSVSLAQMVRLSETVRGSVFLRGTDPGAGMHRPRSPSTTLSRAFSSDLLYRSPATSPLPGSPTRGSPYCTPPDEDLYMAPPGAATAAHPLPPPHPSISSAAMHHPGSLGSAHASSSSLYQSGHLDHLQPPHSSALIAVPRDRCFTDSFHKHNLWPALLRVKTQEPSEAKTTTAL